MDLEAADIADARTRKLVRYGMFACFIFAGGVLLASLALANDGLVPNHATPAKVSLLR
jgi:hypothetical protein